MTYTYSLQKVDLLGTETPTISYTDSNHSLVFLDFSFPVKLPFHIFYSRQSTFPFFHSWKLLKRPQVLINAKPLFSFFLSFLLFKFLFHFCNLKFEDFINFDMLLFSWKILSVFFGVYRFGKVFKTHILGTPIIVSTDPDVNKVILQNHGSTFIPAYPKSITELLGKYSILQMNGNLQKKLHALIGGFLRSPQLKSQITDAIEDSVKLALDSWRDMSLVYVQQETRKVNWWNTFT